MSTALYFRLLNIFCIITLCIYADTISKSDLLCVFWCNMYIYARKHYAASCIIGYYHFLSSFRKHIYGNEAQANFVIVAISDK